MISTCAKCVRMLKDDWKQYWNTQDKGEFKERPWLHLCEKCYAKK